MGDVIEEWLREPENLTKIYLAMNVGIIMTNLLMALGALIFVMRLLEFF